MPQISVIVPCYNQAQYLDECLQSVLDQTFTDWECIIVNDGSPDNTEEIALRWTEKDSRFSYLKLENGGVSRARNEGIKFCSGAWILPLDGDDRIGDNYLEHAAQKFTNNYDIIYSDAEYFGKKIGPFILPPYDDLRLIAENLIFATSFFRKSDWEQIGGYDENLNEGYEDWDFWLSMLSCKKTLKVCQLNYTGLFYRIKSESRNVHAVHNDMEIRAHLFKKHQKLYSELIPLSMQFFSSRTAKLENENKHLRNILRSKRYLITDKILDFLRK